MDFLSRLTVRALLGGLLGTVLGLVLLALDLVENPFWLTSVGIGLGAVSTAVEQDEGSKDTTDPG